MVNRFNSLRHNTIISCNNNDSNDDGVPDCNDEIMNGIHDFSDLGLLQIVATGISAVPVGHEVSYVFELEEREYISPLEAQGTPSLRIFDEIGRVLLVNSRSNELSNIVLTIYSLNKYKILFELQIQTRFELKTYNLQKERFTGLAHMLL